MYNEFAYFYDSFNGAADYRRLHRFLCRTFRRQGVPRGAVVADLGCGTGTLCLSLARRGYQMLAVDSSPDMLAVLADKLAAAPRLARRVQLLRQPLEELDLYGTVQGALATFDTLDHIGPAPRLAAAIRRAALFMDKGAVFIFDMNTPYKYRRLLQGHTYTVRTPHAVCRWSGAQEGAATRITVHICTGGAEFRESFLEYSYTCAQVCRMCEAAGLQVLRVLDGERFRPLRAGSQRMLFVARKRYTQAGADRPLDA